jgi:hypothetical protein
MSDKLIYSIIETPAHPVFSALYTRLGFIEMRFSSQRKAMNELKLKPATFVVAEFIYGFGNNYAGVNVSNLDVLLMSLQRYSPATRTIVLTQKDQYPHIHKLEALFSLYKVLPLPVTEQQLENLLLPHNVTP